eukprot:UN07719
MKMIMLTITNMNIMRMIMNIMKMKKTIMMMSMILGMNIMMMNMILKRMMIQQQYHFITVTQYPSTILKILQLLTLTSSNGGTARKLSKSSKDNKITNDIDYLPPPQLIVYCTKE